MTPAIDLRPDHRKVVEDILNKHLPHGVKVWVFGSRAEWTTKDSSDLDLALEGDGPLDTRSLIELELAFEDSLLPFRVDVVDLARVEDGFREILEANRKPWRKGPIGRRDWIQGVLADACKAIDYGLTASASSDARGPKFLRITDIVSGHIDWSSVPYVTVDDAMRAKYKLHDGDIVIARTGASTGASAFVKAPPDAVFASYLVRLQARKGYDARFLAYSLKSDQFWNFLRGVLGDKSAQPNASASTITRGPLRAPKCQTEQRAIGRVLGALDDRIDMNRRMNETLEAMARALFKSWFVDFDPVRAKMEGRDTGLPPDIADLFPSRLVDSELGQIPKGWDTKTLGDLCEPPQYGYTASAKTDPVGPRFLRITDINKRSWVAWESVPYCAISSSDLTKYRLHRGDILIARMADPGHGVLVEDDELAVFASYLIRFRPLDPLFSRFLQYWLRSGGYWEVVSGRFSGTTRMNINARQLRSLPLVVPSDETAEAFASQINALRAAVVSSAKENSWLTQVRDNLLPKLVSGVVGLPETLFRPYGETATS